MRRLFLTALGLALVGAALVFHMYNVALRDPVVRRAEIALLTPGSEPVRTVLMADLHVAGPDMPPERLARIVGQVNALRPDLILIAGDMVSDKSVATELYSAADAVAPLARLQAPLGVFAVPGNHDHWRGIEDFDAAFETTDIRFLKNETADLGAFYLAGVDDEFSGHDNVAETFGTIPARVALTHSPDVIPDLPPGVRLVFAGHTHCGQIRLPLIGALSYMSKYGDRFACGHVRDAERDVFVSAGLGTSLLPLRLGAVPDMWLVTITARSDASSR